MGFIRIYDGIPSGNLFQFANWKMAVEIVDLPSYNMVDLSIVFCMFTRRYVDDPGRTKPRFVSVNVSFSAGLHPVSGWRPMVSNEVT